MRVKRGSGSFRKAKKASVRRIVVDERLTEGVVRILIAPLANGVDKIIGDQTEWEDEQELIVTPKTFIKKLDLKSKRIQSCVCQEMMGSFRGRETTAAKEKPLEEMIWQGFQEGQVFIDGTFTVVGNRYEPKAIRVREGGKRDFMRIDGISLIKEKTKKLYSAALRGKEVTDA